MNAAREEICCTWCLFLKVGVIEGVAGCGIFPARPFEMSCSEGGGVSVILANYSSKVTEEIIAVDISNVATALFSAKLIDADVYKFVSDDSYASPERGRRIVQEVIQLVKIDSNKFVKFLEVLRNTLSRDATELIQTMEEECKCLFDMSISIS